ncbi:MAGa3780 family membrane protein [Mesomycoplasma hyorhinis]|uniref:MAGa3780 family membrane protein n=1 Tax=Mesomycoplasma hyorhinis TaxID=2100 RepID=UPI00136EFC2E|nr:hypothetical protein [Mesomycoplasma hyorhinis]MXR06844.1 hypothetical protein [Mesomycoplasma hyorhinis]MXR09808.1 hypothetical protein [Mesomycoplasma hyorhinis]
MANQNPQTNSNSQTKLEKNVSNMKLKFWIDWKKEHRINFVFALWAIISTFVIIAKNIATNYVEFSLPKFYFVSFVFYFQNISSLFYFTYQTNIIFAVALLIYVLNPSRKKFQWLFSSIVLLTITFIVFWTLIAWHLDFKANIWETLQTLVVHLVNPILSFISLKYLKCAYSIKKYTFIYPILYSFGYYLFCCLLFFFSVRQYTNVNFHNDNKIVYFYTGLTIYPFLNFYHPFFYSGTSNSIVILLNLITLISIAIVPFMISWFWIKVYKIKYHSLKIRQQINRIYKKTKKYLIKFKKEHFQK